MDSKERNFSKEDKDESHKGKTQRRPWRFLDVMYKDDGCVFASIPSFDFDHCNGKIFFRILINLVPCITTLKQISNQM